MNKILRLVASAALTLTLVSGVGLSLSGCSAETLSGPGVEAYGTETGASTSGGGSEHNNLAKTDGGTSGSTGGGGSEHNN